MSSWSHNSFTVEENIFFFSPNQLLQSSFFFKPTIEKKGKEEKNVRVRSLEMARTEDTGNKMCAGAFSSDLTLTILPCN